MASLKQSLGDKLNDVFAEKAAKVLAKVEADGHVIPENKRLTEMADVVADLREGRTTDEAAARLAKRRSGEPTSQNYPGTEDTEQLPAAPKEPTVADAPSAATKVDADPVKEPTVATKKLSPEEEQLARASARSAEEPGLIRRALKAVGLGSVAAGGGLMAKRELSAKDDFEAELPDAEAEDERLFAEAAKEDEVAADEPAPVSTEKKSSSLSDKVKNRTPPTPTVTAPAAPRKAPDLPAGAAPKVTGLAKVDENIAAPDTLKVAKVFEEDYKNLDTEIKKYGENFAETLDAQDREALSQLEQRQRELQQLYKENVNRTEWAEVADLFAGALARIGAGLYGLKTGLDVSGFEFKPLDWSKRYERHLGELKTGLESATETQKAKAARIKELRDSYQDLLKRRSSSAKELGSAEMQTNEKNVSNQMTWQDRVQKAKEFNARAENDASLKEMEMSARAALAKFSADAAAARQDDEQSFRAGENAKDRSSREKIAGENRAAARAEKDDYWKRIEQQTAARQFTVDTANWTKAQQNAQKGINMLRTAGLEPDKKKKAAALAEAKELISSAYGPGEFDKAVAGATDDGFFRDTLDTDALVETLSKLPPPPKPVLDDYRPGGPKSGEIAAAATAEALDGATLTTPIGDWDDEDRDALDFVRDNANSDDPEIQEQVQITLGTMQKKGLISNGK